MNESKITRREFISGLAAAGAFAELGQGQAKASKIDRYTLVSRHNPIIRRFDPLSPLSVGNGEFAFTCDITGLQTFPDLYKDAMPLCTMSQWGWHTTPQPKHLQGKELRLNEYETHGRKVGYATARDGQEELFNWLRENPHRLHLGQIGLRLMKVDGSEAKPANITDVEQRLDLWTGTIHSSFRLEGVAVRVVTAVHPSRDLLAVRVDSNLAEQGRIAVRFAFPYGSPTMHAADWHQSDRHVSVLTTKTNGGIIERQLDNDRYFVELKWHTLSAKVGQQGPHEFLLKTAIGRFIDFTVEFSPIGAAKVRTPFATTVFEDSADRWSSFWKTGASVEFSDSRDPRANELERRIVLSQ